MNERELSTYSTEEISQLILITPADQLSALASSLTPEQVSIVTHLLEVKREPHWREKISAVIQGLTETKQLEAVGRSLSLPQILYLLDESNKNEGNGHWKLPPLFVGMPHRLFTQMLLGASPTQMNALKQEVITESLQHHLTVLTHEIVHQIPEFAAKIDDLEQGIANLNVSEMEHADLRGISHQIEDAAKFYEDTIHKINKILALAWNTNRADLIEKLSMSKELSQKLIGSLVGIRRSRTDEPSGLFAKLEDRLNRVYGLANDPQDIEALENDEPAIEALVKLSIWYLRDYWEIGLLPKVINPIDLDFEASHFNHDQKMELREHWHHEVTNNLSKLGLNCVKDLKEARIFSKSTLLDYITRNAHLLF
jgi:hypothetical protein